ncbi:FxsA protein [hydrothermal vent metagenome]|uniref:FxsA protein n=1 Tax=hydrothermal vent metagenome TaxID=652676 RepID=A0A3B1B8H9_9ZZZZ
MPLFRILFLLFLSIPVIEIYLLIRVGEVIGAIPTIFMVVFTAVLGVTLLRWQGLVTLTEVQAAMARGELPAMALLEGALLLIAGALLLTPGFFTDTIGFVLLIPPLRRSLAQSLLLRGMFQAGGGFRRGGFSAGSTYEGRSGESKGPKVIEGEYKRRNE